MSDQDQPADPSLWLDLDLESLLEMDLKGEYFARWHEQVVGPHGSKPQQGVSFLEIISDGGAVPEDLKDWRPGEPI